MPTYEFVCGCGRGFALRLAVADHAATTACPSCGEQARRRYRAPYVPRTTRAALADEGKRAAPTAGGAPVVPRPRRDRARSAGSSPPHRCLPTPRGETHA